MTDAATASLNQKSLRRAETGNGRKPKLRSLADDGESRSQMLLGAMHSFRDGNFSFRLPTDWAGVEGQIALAFNQAIAHEDRISREVERLSVTVGRDGRLKQRMSLPGAIGQWAVESRIRSIR